MIDIGVTDRQGCVDIPNESPEWCQGFGEVAYTRNMYRCRRCEREFGYGVQFEPECPDCGCVLARRV